MTPANYGTAPCYDKKATDIAVRKAREMDGIKRMSNVVKKAKDEVTIEMKIDKEHLIAEHIVKGNEYKLNIYEKEFDGQDYFLTNSYSAALKDYEELRLEDILDVSRFFPVKNLVIEQMQNYLLGYTAIGAQNIFRNSRLVPGEERTYEVDVHETIHTDDEFETRILTSWILDKDVNKYLFEKGVVYKFSEREKRKGN